MRAQAQVSIFAMDATLQLKAGRGLRCIDRGHSRFRLVGNLKRYTE